MSASDARSSYLAGVLYSTAFGHEPIEGCRYADAYARGIIADPQAHIDALVEAGVLADRRQDVLDIDWYTVAQPASHDHAWHVDPYTRSVDPDKVILACEECDTTLVVANRLPIEIPS